jgi:hypothetical protein
MLADIEAWDDLRGTDLIFRAQGLALLEQLQFGSQVRNALAASQHGQVPWHYDRGVSATDPVLVRSLADGHVKHPRSVRSEAAPDDVLVPGDVERRESPSTTPHADAGASHDARLDAGAANGNLSAFGETGRDPPRFWAGMSRI